MLDLNLNVNYWSNDHIASPGDPVKIPSIKAEVLKKVIEYCAYARKKPLKKIEIPLKSADMDENVSDKWYSQFTKDNNAILYELVCAADFLEIIPLAEISCAAIAAKVKGNKRAIINIGKTPEEIRNIFHIEKGFTAEEEKQMLNDYHWEDEAF